MIDQKNSHGSDENETDNDNIMCMPQIRTIIISGMIKEGNFARLSATLEALSLQSKKPITIKISSDGGDLMEAFAMAGAIRECTCKVLTIGYGLVASAAVLLLACGDDRKMSQFATVMHHEASYGYQGRHSTMKNLTSYMNREEIKFCRFLAEITKKPLSYWMKKGKHVDFFLSADECLEIGLINQILL